MDFEAKPNRIVDERFQICVVFIFCGLLLFTMPPVGFVLWIIYLVYLAMKKDQPPRTDTESYIEVVSDETIDQTIQRETGNPDIYEVPTICPVCGSKLRLDTIKWIDDDTGLCPKCESIVQAS